MSRNQNNYEIKFPEDESDDEEDILGCVQKAISTPEVSFMRVD